MADVSDAPDGLNGHLDDKKPAVVEVMAPVDDARPGAEEGVQDEDWDYPFPTDFKISEHPIDEVRPLKVGLAGTLKGCLRS